MNVFVSFASLLMPSNILLINEELTPSFYWNLGSHSKDVVLSWEVIMHDVVYTVHDRGHTLLKGCISYMRKITRKLSVLYVTFIYFCKGFQTLFNDLKLMRSHFFERSLRSSRRIVCLFFVDDIASCMHSKVLIYTRVLLYVLLHQIRWTSYFTRSDYASHLVFRLGKVRFFNGWRLV